MFIINYEISKFQPVTSSGLGSRPQLCNTSLCALKNGLFVKGLRDAGMYGDDLSPLGEIRRLFHDISPNLLGVDICFGEGNQADYE